jgi:hypothetical protein
MSQERPGNQRLNYDTEKGELNFNSYKPDSSSKQNLDKNL